MGLTIAQSLLKGRLVRAQGVVGSDPRPGQRARLRKFKVKPVASNGEVVDKSDIVFLAVKPQEMEKALKEVESHWRKGQLIISIAAGISTQWIQKRISKKLPVVRVMPNTPAQVGQGVSVICGGRFARTGDLTVAQILLSSMGEVLELPEKSFHGVTAISGSGPAYVFYLMEAMAEAGRKLGLPGSALQQLVLKTVSGSAQLAASTGEKPETLRTRVTSKGGTTEAALKVFDQKKVKKGLVRGIRSAAARSKQLGA